MKIKFFSILNIFILIITSIDCRFSWGYNRDKQVESSGQSDGYFAPFKRFANRFHSFRSTSYESGQGSTSQQNIPEPNNPDLLPRLVRQFREKRRRSRARWNRWRNSNWYNREPNEDVLRNFGGEALLRAGLEDNEDQRSPDIDGSYQVSNAMVRRRRRPTPPPLPLPPPPPSPPFPSPENPSEGHPSSESNLDENREQENPKPENDAILKSYNPNDDSDNNQGENDPDLDRGGKRHLKDEDYFVPDRIRQKAQRKTINRRNRGRMEPERGNSRRNDRYFENGARGRRSQRTWRRNRNPGYSRQFRQYEDENRRSRSLSHLKSNIPKDYFRIMIDDQDSSQEPESELDNPRENSNE